MTELIEVRCPLIRVSKSDGKKRLCDNLVVKNRPGSSGEAYCWRCDKRFDYEVSDSSFRT